MTSITWYINRLRAMSGPEILHRLEEKRRKIAARRWRGGWQRFAPTPADEEDAPAIAGLRAAVEAAPAWLAPDAARTAAGLLDGRFAALGQEWPRRLVQDLFPETVWRLDPVTGGLWPGPERYTFDIGYRHEQRLGDIKYVWEFNRLQFLQPLAVDALLNDRAAALAAIEAAVESWHAANPPFRGLAWNSGIELALRAISLLVASSLCGERLSPATRRRIRQILRAHALWLKRYPSRFSSANNHLVAEAAGEFLIASAMPRMPNAARLRGEAESVLVAEALRQILPDGVGAEQSPTYGAFTVEFLLLCAFAAKEGGEPWPERLGERLGRFVDFAAWLEEADGTVPPIGDDDEGRVLTFCEPEPDYVTSVAASAAGLFRSAGLQARPRRLRNAVFGDAEPAGTAPEGLKVFADGGYSVVRGELNGSAFQLILDHGPLGYLSIAAHGHADALSVLLSLDGRPVLVDPGTYLYHSGGAWRDWFRGTPAHNTLTLASENQSTISGAFNWSHRAEACLDEAVAGHAWRLRASHDGYARQFGVRHERTVEAVPSGIRLTDRLLGGHGPLAAALSFQLAADLSARVEGARVQIGDGARTLLTMTFPDAAVTVRRGEGPGAGGWVSPAFGRRQEADRVVWNGVIDPRGVGILIAWE